MRAAAENILHDRLNECLSRLSSGLVCLHCGGYKGKDWWMRKMLETCRTLTQLSDDIRAPLLTRIGKDSYSMPLRWLSLRSRKFSVLVYFGQLSYAPSTDSQGYAAFMASLAQRETANSPLAVDRVTLSVSGVARMIGLAGIFFANCMHPPF